MKVETAIKNAMEIARRVKSVNGILATPACRREAVRIKRIWVFGSTVKGSVSPNDLDLLIDLEECGIRRKYPGETRLDKDYFRSTGWKYAASSRKYALLWLSKGMKKVSRHCLDTEMANIDVKVLLYPRNDFASIMKVKP